MKVIDYKSLLFSRSILLGAGILLCVVAVFSATPFADAAGNESQTGKHILSIHDGDQELGVLTEAATLRDALKEADIVLDKNDITEPALDDKLIAANYDVNIYRARPVVVIDAGSKTRVMSAYRTPKQIAKHAGITLHDEDKAAISQTNNILQDGASLVMTIERATPFTFIFYGKTTEAYTQAKTVADMLKQKNITLGSNDGLSVPADTPITSGMTVQLWRNGEQTLTQDEDIAFDTEEIKDANREKGTKEIKTPGVNGKKTVTYKIVMQDGKEVSRTAVNSVTTKEPVKQVEIIGAKYRGASSSPSENQQRTWDFLMAKGLSREQTAGIMGNLMQEHGFNTTGDGLAQWTGSRKAKLMSMPDPYSIDTQLDFLWYELSGPYVKVLNNIRSSSTVEQSVVVFQDQYERCGVCVESRRIQFAYNILASH